MIHGWDDAPNCEITLGLFDPKPITFVYPYYCNPDFLHHQLSHWSSFPEHLRSFLTAIIVDDGSPEGSAESVLKGIDWPFPIRLYRIEKDVRWNWLAARNLAMYYADGWCVGTDMDHVIPQDTAWSLVSGNHDHEFIYRFKRREYTGEVIHPHPNSWFMTRRMFWKFGGYDEALSGYYGTDGDARRRWVKTAPVFTLPDYLVRYERIGDSSTTRYERKEKVDLKAQRIIKSRGRGWQPKVLSFPYHEVSL